MRSYEQMYGDPDRKNTTTIVLPPDSVHEVDDALRTSVERLRAYIAAELPANARDTVDTDTPASRAMSAICMRLRPRAGACAEGAESSGAGAAGLRGIGRLFHPITIGRVGRKKSPGALRRPGQL